MESSLAPIQALVNQIKQEMLSSTFNPYSFFNPSAYDTSWLAMIPHPKQDSFPKFKGCLDWVLNNQKKEEDSFPKFKGCLDWVLNNQKEEGYWGETGTDGLPTIDSLPATLACMMALKTWGVGQKNLKKGNVCIINIL